MEDKKNIKNLIQRLSGLNHCKIIPSSGLPQSVTKNKLPLDLLYFYSMCGGIIFNEGTDLQINIVRPDEFVLTNNLIIGIQDFIPEDDLSYEWYVIADCPGGEQRISIDLNINRLGHCYDSFWQNHAIRGSCFTMSFSFIDLLTTLSSEGEEPWNWMNGEFNSLGDPYEGTY